MSPVYERGFRHHRLQITKTAPSVGEDRAGSSTLSSGEMTRPSSCARELSAVRAGLPLGALGRRGGEGSWRVQFLPPQPSSPCPSQTFFPYLHLPTWVGGLTSVPRLPLGRPHPVECLPWDFLRPFGVVGTHRALVGSERGAPAPRGPAWRRTPGGSLASCRMGELGPPD